MYVAKEPTKTHIQLNFDISNSDIVNTMDMTKWFASPIHFFLSILPSVFIPLNTNETTVSYYDLMEGFHSKSLQRLLLSLDFMWKWLEIILFFIVLNKSKSIIKNYLKKIILFIEKRHAVFHITAIINIIQRSSAWGSAGCYLGVIWITLFQKKEVIKYRTHLLKRILYQVCYQNNIYLSLHATLFQQIHY